MQERFLCGNTERLHVRQGAGADRLPAGAVVAATLNRWCGLASARARTSPHSAHAPVFQVLKRTSPGAGTAPGERSSTQGRPHAAEPRLRRQSHVRRTTHRATTDRRSVVSFFARQAQKPGYTYSYHKDASLVHAAARGVTAHLCSCEIPPLASNRKNGHPKVTKAPRSTGPPLSPGTIQPASCTPLTQHLHGAFVPCGERTDVPGQTA
jgi:hypothetical protein